ncbi:MAG: hypothetical protein IJV67_07870 [Clostridia bacterium]|nr:hypothetical protein [Clostridia bacterium]
MIACNKGGKTSQAQSGSSSASNSESVVEPEETEGYVSLLTDKTFSNGFWMRGLGAPIYGDPIETFGDASDPNVRFQYGKENLSQPEWNLCQWATRYPFHDVNNSSPHLPEGKINYAFEDLGNGKYQYTNSSKSVRVDTATGELSLGLKASECYKYHRTQGQEWPHLLVEKYICNQANPPKQCHIASSQSLMMNVDVRVNSFVDYMGEEANPGLHSAICVMYLFVSNLDRGMFTDMLWFGIYLFDNRYIITSQESFPDVGTKGSATEKWIFNVASSEYFDLDYNLKTVEGEIIFNEWRTVQVDVLGKIYEAFNSAQANGYMKNSKWENLYINGMYFGFELPGTYDIDMSFKNLDVTSYIEY